MLEGTGSRPACPPVFGGPRIVPASPGAAGERAGGCGDNGAHRSIGAPRRVWAPPPWLQRARVGFTPSRCPLLGHATVPLGERGAGETPHGWVASGWRLRSR